MISVRIVSPTTAWVEYNPGWIAIAFGRRPYRRLASLENSDWIWSNGPRESVGWRIADAINDALRERYAKIADSSRHGLGVCWGCGCEVDPDVIVHQPGVGPVEAGCLCHLDG